MDDKTGNALKQQRFQMLQDIAKELSGSVTVSFPTSFNVVIKLRDALNDPDWSLDGVAKLLNVEPLISSRLVGLANSAAYRRGRHAVVDVRTAVQKLGINLVRSTALGIATRQFKESASMQVFSEIADQYWDHSLRTASAAYVIAKELSEINPEEAMLAGLSHDIGAFYMLYRAAQYEELRARPKTVRYLVTNWHEQIGHALMVAMGLPEEIAEAVKEHDHPRPVPRHLGNLTDVLYVANLMADCAFIWEYLDENELDPRQLVESMDEQLHGLEEPIMAYEGELRAVFH